MLKAARSGKAVFRGANAVAARKAAAEGRAAARAERDAARAAARAEQRAAQEEKVLKKAGVATAVGEDENVRGRSYLRHPVEVGVLRWHGLGAGASAAGAPFAGVSVAAVGGDSAGTDPGAYGRAQGGMAAGNVPPQLPQQAQLLHLHHQQQQLNSRRVLESVDVGGAQHGLTQGLWLDSVRRFASAVGARAGEAVMRRLAAPGGTVGQSVVYPAVPPRSAHVAGQPPGSVLRTAPPTSVIPLQHFGVAATAAPGAAGMAAAGGVVVMGQPASATMLQAQEAQQQQHRG